MCGDVGDAAPYFDENCPRGIEWLMIDQALAYGQSGDLTLVCAVLGVTPRLGRPADLFDRDEDDRLTVRSGCNLGWSGSRRMGEPPVDGPDGGMHRPGR